MEIKQFDVLVVNFSPTRGREQKGMRPCIVLETNGFRGEGSVTIVCPLTTQLKKIFSFETVIEPSSINGLTEVSKMLIRQLRVIDKTRITKKIGRLERKYHESVISAIAILFDIRGDFAENI